MKKLLFAFPIVAFLAVGCNSSQQLNNQTSVKTPAVQNIHPTSSTTQTTEWFTPNTINYEVIKYNNNIFSLVLPSTYTDFKVYTKTGLKTEYGDNATGYYFNLPVIDKEFMPEVGTKGYDTVDIIYIIPRNSGQSFPSDRAVTVKANQQYYAVLNGDLSGKQVDQSLNWDFSTFKFSNNTDSTGTFMNKKYGFQISYPTSWYVMDEVKINNYPFIDIVDSNAKDYQIGNWKNIVHITVDDPTTEPVDGDSFYGNGNPDLNNSEKNETFVGVPVIKSSLPGFIKIQFVAAKSGQISSIGAAYEEVSRPVIDNILNSFKFINK